MKMNKLVFPLVLVMAGVMATTGCKKGFTKVTPLPGPKQAMVGDNNGAETLPPAGTLGGDNGANANNTGVGTKTGGGDTAGLDEFEGMIKDPAALAAYTVHFKFDSAVVQDSEQANIASVAQALVSNVNDKLLIEGNCDERGTEEYNRSLGERRALALREALAKVNVSPDRVRTISYGKDKPADPGHDEAAWAKNRRGDFILLHPKAGV
jgi:peptidoglycan-associated lipoprotein